MNEDMLLGYLIAENRYAVEREELVNTLSINHGIKVPRNASVLQIAKFLAIIELKASYNITCSSKLDIDDTYVSIDFKDNAMLSTDMINHNSTEKLNLSDYDYKDIDLKDYANVNTGLFEGSKLDVLNISEDFKEIKTNDHVSIEFFVDTE